MSAFISFVIVMVLSFSIGFVWGKEKQRYEDINNR